MIHYLYLITRDDGEKYVGVSHSPDVRVHAHIMGRGNKYLKNRKCSYKILLKGPEKLIYNLEPIFIEIFGTLNIAKGGIGGACGDERRGQFSSGAKLNEKQVLQIRLLASQGLSDKTIAEQFPVSRTCIGDIRRGKTWQNVGGPLTKSSYYKSNTVKNQAIQLAESGVKSKDIVKQLGISKTTLWRYIRKL